MPPRGGRYSDMLVMGISEGPFWVWMFWGRKIWQGHFRVNKKSTALIHVAFLILYQMEGLIE